MQRTGVQVLRKRGMNQIRLEGCAPDQLMMHLKALGAFRIIAEQKDSDVLARWDNDVFTLHSELSRDDLVRFFLDKYSPTPIVSPWNIDSGFYDSCSEIYNIKKLENKRLQSYHDVIEKTTDILQELFPCYTEFLQNKAKKAIDEEYKKKLKKETDEFKAIVKKEKRSTYCPIAQPPSRNCSTMA